MSHTTTTCVGRALGIAVLAFIVTRPVWNSQMPTPFLAATAYADEGRLPDLGGAVAWLNSPLIASGSLRGKVVLIDFWTYTCINSLRPLPYLKSWAAKYKDAGLVVVGVHTPEFSIEKERANVETA